MASMRLRLLLVFLLSNLLSGLNTYSHSQSRDSSKIKYFKRRLAFYSNSTATFNPSFDLLLERCAPSMQVDSVVLLV